MRILITGFFVLSLLFILPMQADCQSRSPVQDRRTKVKPPTRSQPPRGSKKPLQRSHRSLHMNPRGFDYGVNLGTSHSLTDIGGKGYASRPSFLDTQWSQTNLNAGMFVRYKIDENISVKSSFNYGAIGGADTLSGENSSRYNRNFSFTNNIFELAFTGEYYLPRRIRIPIDIYGFAGVAVFYHNPELTVPNPEKHNFDPVNTLQPAIPMGIGGYYTFPNRLRVGYEVGWRKTFFDHLDGFTRPTSTGNDSYFFGKVKVSYFIPKGGRSSLRW